MENELYHYGVLGMKWGVRRARPKSTSRSSTRSEKTKKRIKVAKQIGKAVLPTVALSAITYTMAKQTSASGRSFVNSYVSANGSKTMSSLKNELNNFDWSRLNSFRNVARSAGKSVDLSVWNWADHSWEEMNRHPY